MQKRNLVVDSGLPCSLLVPEVLVVLGLPAAVPAGEVDLAAGVLELPVVAGPGLELGGRVLAAVGLLPRQLLLA